MFFLYFRVIRLCVRFSVSDSLVNYSWNRKEWRPTSNNASTTKLKWKSMQIKLVKVKVKISFLFFFLCEYIQQLKSDMLFSLLVETQSFKGVCVVYFKKKIQFFIARIAPFAILVIGDSDLYSWLFFFCIKHYNQTRQL